MAGSVLLCFLDCYSWYHQIALHPDDEDKTTFITPHDIYCYKVKTFGLKNARATYQKAIQKCLKSQIGKNVEAYVMMWSSRQAHLQPLRNLRHPTRICNGISTQQSVSLVAPRLHGWVPGH
jgi:hypothetical protein